MTELIANPYFKPIDYSVAKGRNNIKNKYTKTKMLERQEFVAQRFDTDATILDVGCAEGEFLRELCNVGFQNKNIFGVEPSLDAENVEEFTIFGQNPTDKVFDLITCFHVLEHIIDTQKFINELCQMMHHTSKLIIEVPNWTGHPLVEEEKNSEHVYLFSASSFLSILSIADLDVLELHTKKFESPGYRDNIRIVAQKKNFQTKFKIPNVSVSVFGTGGDYNKYVEPLNLEINNYFDRDEKKLIGNIKTIKYSENFKQEKILISSLHYEDEIYNYLITNRHPKSNILLLSDLLMSMEI